MEALLWAIEDVSKIFGLSLNESECQQKSYRKSSNILFKDGTKAPKTDTVEYLGSLLREKASPRPEIKHKKQMPQPTAG